MKSYPSIPCFCCTLIYATVRSTKLGHFGKNIPNRTFQIEQRPPFQYGDPISRSLPSHAASSISMVETTFGKPLVADGSPIGPPYLRRQEM